MKKLDVNNFDNFTEQEHIDNLLILGIESYNELVGKKVYYVKPGYGVHKVVSWDPEKGEYLLDLFGSRFWTDPFKIKNCYDE